MISTGELTATFALPEDISELRGSILSEEHLFDRSHYFRRWSRRGTNEQNDAVDLIKLALTMYY